MSFLMIYGAFCLSILLFPSVLFIAIPSRRVIILRRKYISTCCGIYLDFTYFLIEYLCGTRVHIYSDDPSILQDTSGVLILSNHRTRTDWLYVGLCYSSFLSVMSNMVIILKDSLRTAPVFGWIMQLALYIFLKRSRENDLPHIAQMLTYLSSLGSLPSLLLFPEGTDLSDSNISKSNRFAAENGLPLYEFVLHPKPSGLVTAANCFREQQRLKQSEATREQGGVVHDLTIAYEDYRIGKRSSEKSFLFGLTVLSTLLPNSVQSPPSLGKFPTAVHLFIQRIPLETFPTEKREIEQVSSPQHPSLSHPLQWLRRSFDSKEARLRDYYSVAAPAPSSLPARPLSHSQSMAIHALRRDHIASSWPAEVPLTPSRHASRWRAVALMASLMTLVSLALYSWPYARWAVAGVVMVFVSSAHIFSGFDNLELLLHAVRTIPPSSSSGIAPSARDKKVQ
jgi:1-acyl-sn-glycerol-3-phosphate acyltransferase